MIKKLLLSVMALSCTIAMGIICAEASSYDNLTYTIANNEVGITS